MKVVITGGNGFIGSHIVHEFVKNGVEVLCLVRKNSQLSNISGLELELVYGDVTSKNSLENLFTGADLVIHNAALSTDWAPYKEFYETNVNGTVNVLESCIEQGVKKVIITGSISSYGEENSSEVKDETSPFNSHYPYFMDKLLPCKMNWYRDTKAFATQKALEIAKKNGINLIILEPAFVYGEREFNTGFYEYVKSAKSGMFIAPGSKKNFFPVIYAGDLAKAYWLTAINKIAGVERIIIANKKNELMSHIFGKFCNIAGVRKPVICSKVLFYLPGIMLEFIYTLLKVKIPPLLTRGRVNMFVDNLEFSTNKAKDILKFESTTSLDDGINKTVKWYKDNNYL
ncbi:MAG: SDR family NAD(P)-dependent oxidoreductase [Desulfobacterales bacterium]|nr:SDR family NAD(P)-dependent oxidoreductase [Desulfobacterales bacterium]MCP4161846.1 SDR family NAD(P)-dependent oxidoreductase [Deltaproteobacteria bacterium]